MLYPIIDKLNKIIDLLENNAPHVGLTQSLTECESSISDFRVLKENPLTITYTPSEGYELPEEITVKIGEDTATVDTDYTFSDGVLNIPADKVAADISITVTATEIVSPEET